MGDHPVATKAKRARVPRSCDRCRKCKIRCVFEHHTDRCNACLLQNAECGFTDPGSLKERAPTLKEIEHLHARIRSLERFIVAAKPDVSFGHPVARSESGLDEIMAADTPTGSDGSVAHSLDPDGDNLVSVNDAFGALALADNEGACAEIGFPPPESHEYAEPEVDKTLDLWRHWYIKVHSDPAWPESDLEAALIQTYFRLIHPMFPVLNPRAFLDAHASGVQQTGESFRALCLCVFALASHHSDDPRVRWQANGEPVERPASGWRFARGAHQIVWGFCHPADLYEIQTWCLLMAWVTNAASPVLAWTCCGQGLHRATSIGIHRERSKRWTSHPLNDHLRRRVFFELFFRECLISNGLGRAPMMKTADFDLLPAEPTADQCWGTFDTSFVIKPFFDQVEAGQTLTSWHQLVWHPHSVGVTVAQTFMDLSNQRRLTKSHLVDAARKLERDVEVRLDAWAETVPATLKFSSELSDGAMVLAAKLALMPHYLRMGIFRRLHTFDPTDAVSLKRCADEAGELIDKCATLRQRNLLTYTSSWLVFMVTSAGVMTMYHLGKTGAPTIEGMFRFVRRIDEVLSILWALSEKNAVAKKAHVSITKYLSWHSLRASSLHKPDKPGENPGTDEVYRMCSTLASALSTRTVEETLAQKYGAMATDPTASAAPQSQSGSDVSVGTASIPAQVSSGKWGRALPDSMTVDFNPLAFEVTSFLAPSEMWAAGTDGRATESLLANHPRYTSPPSSSSNASTPPSDRAFSAGGGSTTGPPAPPVLPFAGPDNPPPDSWQSLMALLDSTGPVPPTIPPPAGQDAGMGMFGVPDSVAFPDMSFPNGPDFSTPGAGSDAAAQDFMMLLGQMEQPPPAYQTDSSTASTM